MSRAEVIRLPLRNISFDSEGNIIQIELEAGFLSGQELARFIQDYARTLMPPAESETIYQKEFDESAN